jgi:hypothetical protein
MALTIILQDLNVSRDVVSTLAKAKSKKEIFIPMIGIISSNSPLIREPGFHISIRSISERSSTAWNSYNEPIFRRFVWNFWSSCKKGYRVLRTARSWKDTDIVRQSFVSETSLYSIVDDVSHQHAVVCQCSNS